MKIVISLVLVLGSLILKAQVDLQAVEAFAKSYAQRNNRSLAEVKSLLAQATYRPKIIEKITRPAEGISWHRYRKIFMTEERIQAGVEFWQLHAEVLQRVADSSGVPEEIILGILGVETYFGQRKGSHKVLDALYTLAFGYPKRSSFFKKELEEYLLLSEEEQLEVTEVKGSYAGAIGYSQFMPSSYRAYAASYEVGGSKDLINSPEDAIASVANYLKVHRWKRGGKVATATLVSAEATTIKNTSPKPKYTISHFENLGYTPVDDVDLNDKAALLAFEQENGTDYWLGHYNFYVITRYNHSPLYALAVYQLAEAIKDKKG